MRVAIVGGGISGLALAEELASRGAEPLIFEAGQRAGGKVATIRKEGFLLEAGPNGFLDKEPATLRLAARLGIEGKLREAAPAAKKRWIFSGGKLREVPTSPPAFLRSDILPVWAKARVALEPLSGRVAPGVDESIASFGRRHLGRRATRDLLGAMVLGIHGGDAEKLSLASCFPRMVALERQHRSLILAMIRLQREQKASGGPAGPGGALMSCDGGLGTIVDALAAKLGDALHLGAEVRSIERAGEGFRLQVARGGGAEELVADKVAITTPAHVAGPLLVPFDPELGALVGTLPYAPMAVAHLAWPRERISHPLDGFGFLIPPHEQRGILGAMFISSIFPWRAPEDQALFTVMIGGAIRPELVSLDEEALVAHAAAELGPIIGASGDPTMSEVLRWERAIPQYLVGYQTRREEVVGRLAQLPGLHLGGNAWRGIGVNDCVAAAPAFADEILAR